MMKLFYTIILAIALVVLLRAGFYFLKLASRSKPYHHYTLRIFPWIEVMVWIAFVFWAIQNLFLHAAVYPFLVAGLAITIIIAFGWFVLRDIISGAVIRADLVLEPGIYLKTEKQEGVIQSVGFISLELLSADGEKIKIPYSSLSGHMLIQKPQSGQGKSQVLKVRIGQKHGAGNIQKTLRGKMLELPWVVAAQDLKVKLTPSAEDYIAEIHFYTVKEEMLVQTQEVLLEFVKQNFPET